MSKTVIASDYAGKEHETCAVCGEGRASRAFEMQEFEYGAGAAAVTLHARVPVWTCDACEMQYVGAEGEVAQHAAVCRHLGLLAPAEIKAIRIAAGRKQEEFAKDIGCGIASLKRWESGRVIQNQIGDQAVRRFQDERKRARLLEPRFRTTFSDVQLAAAPHFLPRMQIHANAAAHF